MRAKSNGAARALYWCVPFVLAAVQWWISASGLNQIRYEEIAESVRSVYWLDQRLLYDGVYTNVGWYGTLLIVYKIFGFSLFTGKFVRLAVHLAGLLSIASILRRAMDVRAAIVPLVLIGLSPALLYFDSLETSYGLDVMYAAICVRLLIAIDFKAPHSRDFWLATLVGAVMMVAAMSYPAFLVYAPSLAIVVVWLAHRAGGTLVGANIARLAISGLVGLATPLIAAFAYVHTPRLLIYDPETQAGLFRAGGQLGFDPAKLWSSLSVVAHDLFVQGSSYYDEVSHPDFAGPLAIAGLCGLAATIVYLAATKRVDRTILAAAVLLLIASAVAPNLSTQGEPGLRRCTGVLAAYFVLFTLAWQFYATRQRRNIWITAGTVLCLLLPIDNALKVPSLANDVATPSNFRNVDWFAIDVTPVVSLDRLLARLDEGQGISCPRDDQNRVTPCRYQEIYAAMAGYRKWNGYPVVDIHAADWRTSGDDIILSPELWLDHHFPTCTRIEHCR
jgi:hypothetical protein